MAKSGGARREESWSGETTRSGGARSARPGKDRWQQGEDARISNIEERLGKDVGREGSRILRQGAARRGINDGGARIKDEHGARSDKVWIAPPGKDS